MKLFSNLGSSGFDKFFYLTIGGLGTFGFYHYQKKYELRNIIKVKSAENE